MVSVAARRGVTAGGTRGGATQGLPRGGAVIGMDLAEDKQALAVIDHDVRVLARKTVKVKAFAAGRGAGLGRRAGQGEELSG